MNILNFQLRLATADKNRLANDISQCI